MPSEIAAPHDAAVQYSNGTSSLRALATAASGFWRSVALVPFAESAHPRHADSSPVHAVKLQRALAQRDRVSAATGVEAVGLGLEKRIAVLRESPARGDE
jgi:hypothetical protein